VLLGALGQHETVTRYEVRSGDTPESAAEHIRTALATGTKVLVLRSFYSPDAVALAEELGRIHEPGRRPERDAPSARILPHGLLIVGHLDVVQLAGRARDRRPAPYCPHLTRTPRLRRLCRGCGGYAEWPPRWPRSPVLIRIMSKR
jgi:hypothetical protein